MNIAVDSIVVKAQKGDPRAVDELVVAIKDDIYKLAMRMLGERADAEDATQEILINVLKGLGKFRAESSFRTWVWRIAINHILRARRSIREQTCSFDDLDNVLELGEQLALSSKQELSQEIQMLATEVRLSCTTAMILSMDRDHRLAFVLGVVFEFDSQMASEILEISSAAFRKRLERARNSLDQWMNRKCGLVNASAGCRCIRQVAIAKASNHIDPVSLMYSRHPVSDNPSAYLSRTALRKTTDEVDSYVRVLLNHPNYAAPETVTTKLKSLIQNQDLRIFQ